ncbi:MAG: 50S ribosomal protein L16 [Spirochaetes bacterium]|nr:50S ribosomal protein L16 [Spirochaetota bacterium]
MALLIPGKTKYRKQQKGRIRGISKGATSIAFGEFCLYAKECGYITSNQIEASRVAITRFIRKEGKLWIRIFPDKPLSKKPAETRMGKGKGAVEKWVAPVERGRILFELGGLKESIARQAFSVASHKLPIKTGVKVR